MDMYSLIYKRCRESFIRIAFLLAVMDLILEITISIFLIQQYRELIKLDILRYCIFYIGVPSLLNFTFCILGGLGIASNQFSERKRNYIAVLTLSGICFVTSCVHNVYAILPCTLCFPIYISVMFSDRKMTKIVSIISFVMVCISTVFARFDGRANDKLLYVNLFITIVLVISSYMIARYLLRLEIEKHILIKESDQKQIQLTEQLKYDSLTGLYNMSTFYSNLNAAQDKDEFPLSVAVIDIDNFKNVNDTYGHDNGNTVLIYLARLLEAHCSVMGSVYRYGGEEFVVIFRSMAAEEVMPVIEDIQHIFETYQFDFAPQVSITFSCGIASSYQKHSKVRELFNNADKAMYIAKATGKNKTVISEYKI